MYLFIYRDYWTKEVKWFKTLNEEYGRQMTSHPDTLIKVLKMKTNDSTGKKSPY